MTPATDEQPEGEGRHGHSARGAALVSAGILLSRLTGLVRESVLAYFFGASLFADAWRAALRLPNVLQNLLGEGTLSASFIPVYAEFLEEGREEEAGRFAGAALGILVLVAGTLALLGVLLAPVLVGVFFYGFDPRRQALTVTLVRILFPMTGILVVSAWCLGVLNTHRRFFVSYVAPVVWNLAMIATLVGAGAYLALGQRDLVVALAWGALVGGALQVAVQVPFLLSVLGRFRLSARLDTPGVREAIRNFLPVVSARGVVNLSAWLDFALAAFLATGAVAVLGFAQTLYVLPISLFGMAVAASELPELSRTRRAETRILAGRVARALERVSFFVIPSALAYLFFGEVIVAALFQRGAFGLDDTLVTYGVLVAYALGLPASAGSRVLSSGFYAVRDTRTPARVAYLRVAVSLGLGAALMIPLDAYAVGRLRLGAAGLALGATVGAWLEYRLLRKRLGSALGSHGPEVSRMLSILAATVPAVGAGVGAEALLPGLPPIPRMLGTLLPFGVVYLAITWLLGVAAPVLRGDPPGPPGPRPDHPR